MQKLKEQVKKQIDMIVEQGVKPVDVDRLGKLVDIHKDLANEEYWKMKEEGMEMKYKYGAGNYGRDNYGRGNYGEEYGRRARDSRGRYTEGTMGRRYRGEEMMDEMAYHYGNYEEGRGMYGGQGDTQSLEYMLNAAVEFIEMLKRDASSQEEVRLIQQYAKKLGNV